MIGVQASIWLLDARSIDDALLPGFESWLSPQELARYRRFMRPQRQRQFLLGRALLRTLLGQALALPAASIVLEERPGQAPLAPAGAPHFSLSHSGHWIACTLSEQIAVGLDIEVMDQERDLPALARQAFGDAVAEGLAAMAHAEQVVSFYRRWSEYEARYKLGAAAGEAASCVALAHAELSIVLCSAAPLAQPPQLRRAALALAPG
ncbi:4'-phosphopantetheinyl transferase family protein [Janthinobacterium sp. J1-1]|uniref:4'-phosphopantetheinyl transferase family protein n=1 Tax=unclassified Janthinobacterium TaxID=2610881 RepID=UPI0028118DA7|nr:4-phosphopantetheinyl transferase [Janthinobacterium sp. J1-1]